VEKMLDFIEELPEQLVLFNGKGCRPLAYVTRDEIVPPDSAEAPPFGEEGSTHVSMRDESKARSPYETHAYRVDNAAVFKMLNAAFFKHKNINTWIKSFETRKDGRAAFIAFKRHYHGTNKLEAIEA
jgi:hypothetical protein